MSNYSIIDTVISAWATKHSLTVYTEYQGEEVRSIDVVSPQGRKYQIWIDAPNGNSLAVHAWDYKKRRKDWNASIAQLAQTLEEALQVVKAWMAS